MHFVRLQLGERHPAPSDSSWPMKRWRPTRECSIGISRKLIKELVKRMEEWLTIDVRHRLEEAHVLSKKHPVDYTRKGKRRLGPYSNCVMLFAPYSN
jgi:hypothetical protein